MASSLGASALSGSLYTAPRHGVSSWSNRAKSPTAKPPLDLPSLQFASRVIQEQLIKDAQIIPDLGELLTSASGQSSASYTLFSGDFRVPFQKRKHIGIPPMLWEHFQSSRSHCHMGILPEIDRAWISLDHKLFLWDYVEGQELSSFIEQTETILHVALVTPKPGVFIDEIAFLLVICTPKTVLLLALSASTMPSPDNRPHKKIALYATDMAVDTDGVEMSSVVGANDGRIFMCGTSDGNLYELHYQEKEVWFGKRFHIINHSAGGVSNFIPIFRTAQSEERIISVVSDRSRGLLYTLSEQNWISIWKPESNKGLRKIQTLSNLQKQAHDKAPGAAALASVLQLLSLHVIAPKESKSGVQLMALSTKGVRLYFSAAPVGYGYGYNVPTYSPADTKQLQLVHVRLPPMNLPHPDEQYQLQLHPPTMSVYGHATPAARDRHGVVINNVSCSAYIDGLLVTAQQSDVDGKDFILGISPDLSKIGTLGQAQAPTVPSQAVTTYFGGVGQQRPPLTEQATLLYVEGTIWAIANTPRLLSSSLSAILPASPEPLVTNEVATQFSEPHQEFVIVTNVGISFLTKRRVLDFLRDVLEEVHAEGNLQPVLDFRDSFGREQTCAMLLALASGNTFLSAERNGSSAYDEVVTLNADIATIAKQAFYDIGDRPHWVERGFAGDGQGNVIFSGRREGLALYIARLVRPIWRAKVTKSGPSGQDSNVSDSGLVTIQKNLHALKNFLDRNPQLFSSSPGDQVGSRPSNDSEAWKVEQTSAGQLLALLSRTIEAISFVLLLIDYNIGDLIAQCDKDTQQMISSLTYEDLITAANGLHVSRALVNIVINRQIGQQISVDTVSEILQQRCGSFCSADDVMLYKARENVRKAVDVRDPNERQAVLSESLRLFIRAAGVIEFEKLREICGDYQHLNYARGAVELPLHCAMVADPDRVGVEFWAAGCPANDSRQETLNKRLQCYDLTLDSLLVFDEQCAKNTTAVDLEDVRNLAYDFAFSSDDPIFHSHLYDWLVRRGMADTLLEIQPPFLEDHLQREPISSGNLQLLWQLYVKKGQYLRSAEVLAALAKSTQFDLSLETRLECLTLAVSNAKSHPVSLDGKHETAIAFLTEIEDQLEVAQVQMELYQVLSHRANNSPEVVEKVELLQRRLFNITELFQFYAEEFNLSAIKLLILHVSEHRDDAIVRPIWTDIFDEATSEGSPDEHADRIASVITTHGRRFYPSEAAFPIGHVASLLVRWTLGNKGVRPPGWAPRVLKEAGVPYQEIWDVFHAMYESQVPPFNDQDNVQYILSDIAVLIRDWVEDARRPQSLSSSTELPADLLDRAIAKYLEELRPSSKDTRSIFEDLRHQLQRYW